MFVKKHSDLGPKAAVTASNNYRTSVTLHGSLRSLDLHFAVLIVGMLKTTMNTSMTG